MSIFFCRHCKRVLPFITLLNYPENLFNFFCIVCHKSYNLSKSVSNLLFSSESTLSTQRKHTEREFLLNNCEETDCQVVRCLWSTSGVQYFIITQTKVQSLYSVVPDVIFFMRASEKKASCFSKGSIINHHFITVLLQKGNMQPSIAP